MEEGVIGKGIANSRSVRFPAMTRGFVGEEGRDGDDGVSGSLFEGEDSDFGDFGEREASRWVNADCFGAGGIRDGRSARGNRGMFECFPSCS